MGNGKKRRKRENKTRKQKTKKTKRTRKETSDAGHNIIVDGWAGVSKPRPNTPYPSLPPPPPHENTLDHHGLTDRRTGRPSEKRTDGQMD